MLDLDTLAEKRAQTLNEKLESWSQVVWASDFQKLSANMSDGEVETLLGSCKSYRQLEAVVRFLTAKAAHTSPYSVLIQEAKSTGQTLTDWIAKL
jgi:hypothetical protein